MTDRYNALTVSLDRDIRDDDAEIIINAIKALRGVNGVTANVVDPDSYSAKLRANNTVKEKLYELMKYLDAL